MGISSGRIIDNAGRGRLPVGVENFEVVVGNYVYVDKSMLARELEEQPGAAVLFCRPRRFGKSLAMRMLQCYFEAAVPDARQPIPDRTHLFDGLAAGDGDDPERGAHPVIFLSLSEAAAPDWQTTRALLAGLVAGECKRHDYLLGDPTISDADKAKLRRMAGERPEGGDLESSLAWLSGLLADHHGTGAVILIDEYDAPVTQGHLRGFRQEAIDFMRTWLTGALKATTSLYLGIMTGVQRVSRESIFSGLNNITVDTPLDHEFTEAFGFTEAETEALAMRLGHADKVGEMRDWYDGYVFGDGRVYNPWSLLRYLAKDCVAQPYWGNTSGNAVVHDLFAQAKGEAAESLERLAAGGTVSARIDLATVFDMIGRDPSAIWSQLYLAGYLTTRDVAEPNDTRRKRELEVPNREVRALYRDEFYERSRLIAGDGSRLDALHDALQDGDPEALGAAMRRILLDSPSALDLVRENSYHMLLLGLTYSVYGYKFPASNREAGDGRSDLLLVPERENAGKLPAIVVEAKWERKPEGGQPDPNVLEGLARTALDQAIERNYADALPAGPRITWGLGFCGKHVAALAMKSSDPESA